MTIYVTEMPAIYNHQRYRSRGPSGCQHHCSCGIDPRHYQQQQAPLFVRYPSPPFHPSPYQQVPSRYGGYAYDARYAPYAYTSPYEEAHEDDYAIRIAPLYAQPVRRAPPRFYRRQPHPLEDILQLVTQELERVFLEQEEEQEQEQEAPAKEKVEGVKKSCCAGPSRKAQVPKADVKGKGKAIDSATSTATASTSGEKAKPSSSTSSNPVHPFAQFIKHFVENAPKGGNAGDYPFGNLVNLAQVFLETAQQQQSEPAAEGAEASSSKDQPTCSSAPSNQGCRQWKKQRGIVINDASIQEKQDEELARAIEESLKEQEAAATGSAPTASAQPDATEEDHADDVSVGSSSSSRREVIGSRDGESLIEKLQKGHEPIVAVPEAGPSSSVASSVDGDAHQDDWEKVKQ